MYKLLIISFVFSFSIACNKIVNVPSIDSFVKNPFTSFYGMILYNQQDNPKYTIRKWQGIPSIGMDNSGIMYAAWYTGGKGEGLGNFITVSISEDSGKTWLNNKMIVALNDSNYYDTNRLYDPCFQNDLHGKISLTFSRNWVSKNKDTIDKGSLWITSLFYNKFLGQLVATPPSNIALGVMMNKPIISSDSSSIYFPIARWYVDDSIKQRPFIYKAEIGNNGFTNLRKVGAIPLANKLRFVDEHMIVQLKDNSFYAMIRTAKYGIYSCSSKDAINWTDCKKITALGATTSSRFHLRKLKSGRLLLIMNNSTSRTNLKAFLSDDNGLTWPYSLLIDGRANVSYPDMVEGNNGDMYIIYDFDRYGTASINVLKVNEQDIINGFVNNLPNIINKIR
ncbi:sialidase family protein [Parasediminibacterium sp. JCM 36343]|uniref:sialidase family protein n=1 Tax=Parasediminibacterium sp. JCM 36343 TaxID=3374279 RepID=UPI00397D3E17